MSEYIIEDVTCSDLDLFDSNDLDYIPIENGDKVVFLNKQDYVIAKSLLKNSKFL